MTSLPPTEAGAFHAGGWGKAARALERAGVEVRATAGGAACGAEPRAGSGFRFEATARGLVVERAPFGARPLYVGRAGDAWVVAPRPEVVHQALGLTAAPDLDRLAALAVWVPPSEGGATPWRDLHAVPPGVRLVLAGGRARREAAWEVPEPSPPVGDPVAAVVRRLRATVARAASGARRVGVLTSGGLDSSTVLAATAADRRARGLSAPCAIHLAFDGPGADRPHFEALVGALGVEAVRVAPGAARDARAALCLDGGPYPLASGAVELALVEAARRAGVDVLLTGVGGDELFGGEPRALGADGLAGFARALALDVPGGPGVLGRLVGWGLAPRLAWAVPRGVREARAARRDARDYPWAGPRVQAALARARARDAFATRRVATAARARLGRQVLDARWDEHLELRERLEAASGVARRDPLVDVDLATTLAALGPRGLSQGGRHRGLLRDAARALGVPRAVAERRDKAHFEPAFDAAFRAAGGLAGLGDLAEFRRVEAAGLAEARSLRSMLEQLTGASASGDAWSACFQVLAVEAFLATFHAPNSTRAGACA